jgi:hypothetical protein
MHVSFGGSRRTSVLRHQVHSQQEEKQRNAVLAARRKDVLGEAGELPVAKFLARLRWFVAYKHIAISRAKGNTNSRNFALNAGPLTI